MDDAAIETAAERLAAARLAVRPLCGLPGDAAPHALGDAYRVQARLADRLAAGGLGPAAGHKIGCTTRVMQDYLGIPHPCAGLVFAATLRHGEGEFGRRDLCRPGVECEIAVRLGRDLDGEGPVSAAEAGRAVDAAMASIELVDDRWTDFSKVPTPVLVADHFFNAGCVLGPPAAVDPGALAGLKGAMRVAGREAGAGTGADILGDPLEALAWLAEHRRAAGAPLRAGEVVTLGSLVKTVWIEAGEAVEIEIEHLGRCRLVLA